VDHQVKHDADIGSARLEGRNAERLDEEGADDPCLDLHALKQETLEVADLQNDPAPLGKCDERVSLSECGRDRFFHQDVDPGAYFCA
jgi:hypothetical protein